LDKAGAEEVSPALGLEKMADPNKALALRTYAMAGDVKKLKAQIKRNWNRKQKKQMRHFGFSRHS